VSQSKLSMESPRWKIITPSKFEWERRALDFIRKRLPDHDPYRAWSNLEFQADDGAIYEVDLLVLTKQGFWLVECKAWGGRITGNAGSWARTEDGKIKSKHNCKRHLLMVHPGLIARYDQMAVLATLRDKVGHDVPCTGLWVLVASDGQHDLPMLDNAEIPLITPGQRARLSEAWVDNIHRGQSKPVAAADGAGGKRGR
jgi:hypothetical protein